MESKKTTLADIAKKLKISKSAVSLALKDSPMVSKRTRDRVAKAARSMGYIRNELVSSMMSSMKKNAFGVHWMNEMLEETPEQEEETIDEE